MSRVTNSSTEGNYCGRAVHGVSNLSREDRMQIMAHRAKDRPTPWAHLAVRFNVNELDLRAMCEPRNDNLVEPVEVVWPEPSTRDDAMRLRDVMFTAMWNDETPRIDIMAALGISSSTVDLMRSRLKLPRRVPGRKPFFWTEEAIAYVRRHYFVGGESAKCVGRHLGCAHTAVIRLARQKGWSKSTGKRAAK
jgi:hypothetical protein